MSLRRWPRRSAPAVALALGALAAGCGGGAEREPERPAAEPSASRLVSPQEFAREVARRPSYVLNVHVPDEGSLAGTDAAIPFDALRARRGELPPKDTRIAVYCRSGNMSAIASRTLRDLGYRSIVELRGGMNAWTADGRRLLPAGA